MSAAPVSLIAPSGGIADLVRGVWRAFCPVKANMQQGALGASAEADLEAVRRCLCGDPDAYRALIERHQGRVAAMMWRFSRDRETHEDLVQDVFVEGYESLPRFRGEAPFEHWLARIATRVGYRHWKRTRRAQRLQTVPLADWHQPADAGQDCEELDSTKAAEFLFRLLECLPPRDRLVLTLRYVEDRSVAETAALAGWSETMVKVQCWRARKKLERLVNKASRGEQS